MKSKISFASFAVVSFILLGGAGCSLFASTPTETVVPPKPVMEEKKMAAQGDAMMEKEEEKPVENKQTMGTYEDYSSEKIAFAGNGDVVLFFHAPWCPTCKALDTNINTSFTAIPANTKILKVDYDSSSELKKKYGVTYQHTLVQVDKDGNMLTKWSGGNTLASITAKIQ
jgi:thiol-disulfide isomerase/thioredoxin